MKVKSERRNEVDWLRVFAVLLLICVHTAAIFDPFPFTAVKGRPSFGMALFAAFVHEWRLSLLFLASGASTYFALGFLSARGFAALRVKRILVPLLVGTVLVVPVQSYYWLKSDPDYHASYWQFYRNMITGAVLRGEIANSPAALNWAHLWFLFYLFVISVVALPILLYLRTEPGRRLISRVASLCERRGVFLLALPMLLSESALRTKWPGYTDLMLIGDWANFSFYFIAFIYGYVIYSDETLKRLVMSRGLLALACGVVTSSVFLAISFSGPVVGFNAKWIAYVILRGFSPFFWIVAILSLMMRFFNFSNRLLPYANEASYPVYIIHLPICSVIAYYVVRWPAPVLLQFLFIVLTTVACSLVVLELFIKSTNVMRFLFGLKPKREARLRLQAQTGASAAGHD